MPSSTDLRIKTLSSADTAVFAQMMTLFAEAFDERETYTGARPSESYHRDLLSQRSVIAIAALEARKVIGGLVAYELRKFERERSEIYIYDLAVAAPHRRRGIATAMIRATQAAAIERGAHVVFVQADYGDEPAIALYSKLGLREDVLHFDLPLSLETELKNSAR